jgi:flagellin
MVVDPLSFLKDSPAAASSRIIDVADESTAFARYNVLMQPGAATSPQANQTPQSVFRLLG